eukprot:4237848-Pyramimonas_sp.AAC.1
MPTGKHTKTGFKVLLGSSREAKAERVMCTYEGIAGHSRQKTAVRTLLRKKEVRVEPGQALRGAR